MKTDYHYREYSAVLSPSGQINDKYAIPDLPAQWVQPGAFTERMRASGQKGVIYITAPPGYGKTAAVCHWARKRRTASAYISFDEFDNTESEFWGKLADVTEWTRAAGEGSVIILDNLQAIHNEKLLTALYRTIKSNPLCVLISRNYPHDCVLEAFDGKPQLVTHECLRYSREEFALVLENNGIFMSGSELRDLYEISEGWPLCAGMLAHAKGKRDQFKDSLEKYINAEVWDKRGAPAREFLMQISAAKSFSAALCESLTGREDSETLLRGLLCENSYISESAPGEYCLHRFFREYLLDMAVKSGKLRMEELYLRAANWYMERKQYYQAADCTFLCGEPYKSEQALGLLLCADSPCNLAELSACLNALPLDTAADHDEPGGLWRLCAAAYSSYLNGNAERQLHYYDTLLKKINRHVPYTDKGLRHMLSFLGLLDPRKGITEVLENVREIEKDAFTEGMLYPPSLTGGLPFIHRSFRDFSDLALLPGDCADSLWEFIAARDKNESLVLKNTALAGIYLEKGDYAGAEAFCSIAGSSRHAEINLCVMMMRSEVAFAKNKPVDGNRLLDETEAMLKNTGYEFLLHNVGALRTRQSLRTCDAAAAHKWLGRHNVSPLSGIKLHDSYIHFTTARALIAAGETEWAFPLLDKLRKQAVQYNRTMDLIEADMLLAVTHERTQNMEKAMELLAAALERARPYGFTELFISESRNVYRILNELSFQTVRSRCTYHYDAGFLRRMCIETGKRLGRRQVMRLYEKPGSVKLTARQTEVARLLCKGHSYQEIAVTLELSISTIKSYIRELYNRLGVFSIEEAVSKLYETGAIREVM